MLAVERGWTGMRRTIGATVLPLCLLVGACSGAAARSDGSATPTVAASATATPGSTGPEARGYALMTEGPTAGEVLMIGGFVCPECDPTFSGLGDMWALDHGWTSLAPETVPGPADDFAVDAESGRAVLAEVNGVTWSYDPEENTWQTLEIETGPVALHGSRLVYDEGSDRMIVFGGDNFSLESMTDETWAFDLNAGTWEQMHPKKSPPRRTYYAMAYDSDSDRVILFGGSEIEGSPRHDTWVYDYETDTWERMRPKTSPPARTYVVGAYDARADRVIIYGGSIDEEVAAFQDTWAYDYDSDTWTKLAAEAPIGQIAWHAMASNEAGVVLFGGGVTRDDYVADAWVLDPKEGTWSPT